MPDGTGLASKQKDSKLKCRKLAIHWKKSTLTKFRF